MPRALSKIGQLKGFSFEASVPGSKSFTNRALILAAQKVGTTRIRKALICDDTKYLAAALSQFDGLDVRIEGSDFLVTRSRENIGAPSEPIFLGGAGTPVRLVMAFAATAHGVTVVTGNTRLTERPMAHLIEALKQIGVQIEERGAKGCLPVAVTGGAPSTAQWSVNGSVSSQFVSALILFAAQQYKQPKINIEIEGGLVSVPYVKMTLSILKNCGIEAYFSGNSRVVVVPRRPEMEEIVIEPDASGMSYILTAAAITGATVTVKNIGKNSAQGDIDLVNAYARMGCKTEMGDDYIRLTGAALMGIDIDMEQMPDVVLSLAIAATQAKLPTHVTNIANLRVKECDRISAIANELNTLGIKTTEGKDEITVFPGRPHVGQVHCYDDHRVAMAFSLLGLLYDGITVDDPNCVAKSFPGFWDEMARFCEQAKAWMEQPIYA